MSSTSAMAQSYSYADAFDAPSSTEAKVGFKIPLGGDRFRSEDPTYGVSFGVNAGNAPVTSGADIAELAAFNFSGSEVNEARLGGYNFAASSADLGEGPEAGFYSSGGLNPWVITLLVIVGAYAAYELLDDDDDDESSESSSD